MVFVDVAVVVVVVVVAAAAVVDFVVFVLVGVFAL